MAELQEIVDELEAEIRRPISVEDRRWRLLAHSVQPDEADAVRRSSILTRETSPDVVAWLDGLGRGDMAEAAKALSMHRATLYRRLERVEEITGLDLERGDDRLLAHLGLRLFRLAGGVSGMSTPS